MDKITKHIQSCSISVIHNKCRKKDIQYQSHPHIDHKQNANVSFETLEYP